MNEMSISSEGSSRGHSQPAGNIDSNLEKPLILFNRRWLSSARSQRAEPGLPASQAHDAAEPYPAQVIDEPACQPELMSLPVQPVIDKALCFASLYCAVVIDWPSFV